MTLFDYTVLAILGASVLLSVMRGLVREVLALAAWFVAFAAAIVLSGSVAGWLENTIANPSWRALAAFVAVFLTALIAMGLIAWAVSSLLRKAGLGLEDRVLGGFFGFARGLLIVLILVLLAGLTSLPRQPAWNNAMLSPPLVALAGTLKPWLPTIVAANLSYD